MTQAGGDIPTYGADEARVFTISNGLSVTRIVLLPFTLAAIQRDNLVAAFVLIVASVLSDFFDGYFARRLNQISRLGKILDPVVDKVSIDAILIALAYLKGLPVWIPVAVIGRDLITLFAGLFVMGNARTILGSDLTGKIATNSLWAMIVVHLLSIGFLKVPSILFALICVCISLSRYAFRAWRAVAPEHQATDRKIPQQYSDETA